MKQPTFTPNQLDLIGECVLQTIRSLASAQEKILISDACQSIGTTILRCREILGILAKAANEV